MVQHPLFPLYIGCVKFRPKMGKGMKIFLGLFGLYIVWLLLYSITTNAPSGAPSSIPTKEKLNLNRRSQLYSRKKQKPWERERLTERYDATHKVVTIHHHLTTTSYAAVYVSYTSITRRNKQTNKQNKEEIDWIKNHQSDLCS